MRGLNQSTVYRIIYSTDCDQSNQLLRVNKSFLLLKKSYLKTTRIYFELVGVLVTVI